VKRPSEWALLVQMDDHERIYPVVDESTARSYARAELAGGVDYVAILHRDDIQLVESSIGPVWEWTERVVAQGNVPSDFVDL
jgi:hypothetical protein